MQGDSMGNARTGAQQHGLIIEPVWSRGLVVAHVAVCECGNWRGRQMPSAGLAGSQYDHDHRPNFLANGIEG